MSEFAKASFKKRVLARVLVRPQQEPAQKPPYGTWSQGGLGGPCSGGIQAPFLHHPPPRGGRVQLATHGQPRSMHDGQNYSSASAYFSATPPHGVGLRGLRGPNRMCPWRGRVQLATPSQTRSMHDGQNYSSANAYFLATPPHGGGLRPVRGTRQNSACFLATPPHRGGLRGPWSEPDVSIAGKTSKFRHARY